MNAIDKVFGSNEISESNSVVNNNISKALDILKDLLDDHNVIFYGLITLAIIYPGYSSEIAAGILGFWVRDKAKA